MCNVNTLLRLTCLCFVVIQAVNSYNIFDRMLRRQTSRENCTRPNFPCKSGECIDGDKECDGSADCPDASDESNACHRIKCPPYLFTCRYGACINKALECDGKSDCTDGSDENTPKCTTVKTPSDCKENEFRCSSGQCIDGDFKCDGKADCDDYSDEIRQTCWNLKCPGFLYKCKYGACVNGKAKCNKIVECYDGSDEDPTICKTFVPTPTTSTTTKSPPGSGNVEGACVLPEQPKFGQWVAFENGKPKNNSTPGMVIANGVSLQIKCKVGYKIEGNSVTFCSHGKWASGTGQCLRVCPNITSTETLNVSCKNDKITKDCIDAVEGTMANFKCATFYENFFLTQNPVHICQNGSWGLEKPVCDPVCGRKTGDPTPLSVNGQIVTKGHYPWQVAIYDLNKKQICGVSLINEKMIITAAHCITNQNGTLNEKEYYTVAVGKYFQKFNDSRDSNEAQFSELEHMFIPPEYQGFAQNYLGDIAILITKKVFTLSRRVQPVCLDKGRNYDPRNNEYGYVTGWGFTMESGKPSEVLTELKVPYVSKNTCSANLEEDVRIYLTHDKMCAGYVNKSSAVCVGDSGGGLVFKHDGRYYLTGNVSLSPPSPHLPTEGCNSQIYGLYTNVDIVYFKPRINSRNKDDDDDDNDYENNDDTEARGGLQNNDNEESLEESLESNHSSNHSLDESSTGAPPNAPPNPVVSPSPSASPRVSVPPNAASDNHREGSRQKRPPKYLENYQW